LVASRVGTAVKGSASAPNGFKFALEMPMQHDMV